MAVHKAVKAVGSHPFYIEDRPLVDVFQDRDDNYWVTTEVARNYDYLVRYFREKEPEHPLLQTLTDRARTYYTMDVKPGVIQAELAPFVEQITELRQNGDFSRISERRLLERTELLDYLVDRYGVGHNLTSYHLTSRRVRAYEHVEVLPPLEPIFEVLGIHTSNSWYKNMGKSGIWGGTYPQIKAHSVNKLETKLSLRLLASSLFGSSYGHMFNGAATTPLLAGFNEAFPLRAPYGRIYLDNALEQWEELWERTKGNFAARRVDLAVQKLLEERLTMTERYELDRYQKMPVFLLRGRHEKTSLLGTGSFLAEYYRELEDYPFLNWLSAEYAVAYTESSKHYLLPKKEIQLHQPQLPQIQMEQETGDLRQLSLL